MVFAWFLQVVVWFCMVFACVCMVFAWFLHVFVWFLHGFCMQKRSKTCAFTKAINRSQRVRQRTQGWGFPPESRADWRLTSPDSLPSTISGRMTQKPYEFVRVLTRMAQAPCEFVRFLTRMTPRPYECVWCSYDFL